jgi:hypothetical protein
VIKGFAARHAGTTAANPLINAQGAQPGMITTTGTRDASGTGVS